MTAATLALPPRPAELSSITPGAVQVKLPEPPAPLAVIEPGLVSVDVDPDATYIAGRLRDVDMARATRILAYLRERGVLVTASADEILLVIARPIAPELLARITANAALLRAYMACPQCGRRHSLSPPSGWCWPCAEDARLGDRGPCAFAKPDIHDQAAADGTADAETQEEN